MPANNQVHLRGEVAERPYFDLVAARHHNDSDRIAFCVQDQIKSKCSYCFTTASPYQLSAPTDDASYGDTLRYKMVVTLDV